VTPSQSPSANGSSQPERPTPDQLKHMADTQAAPLLAELTDRPNDPDLLAKVGDVYFATRQLDTAESYYQRSLAINAKNVVVLNQLASSYYYAGEVDKSILTLHRALSVDPKYGDALFNLGLIEWQAKSNPKEAIALWEKFLRTNPKHPGRAHVEELLAKAKQHASMKADKPAM
jgi:tetratricopeptide (TPR) repeat protein